MDANAINWISSLANASAEIDELCGFRSGFPSECTAAFDRTKWLVCLGLTGPASSESTFESGRPSCLDPSTLPHARGPLISSGVHSNYILLPDEINRFMEAGMMYFKIAFEDRVSTSARPNGGDVFNVSYPEWP